MAEQWYLARDDQQFGPYTLEQMKEFAREGRLLPQDLVWNEGLSEWVAASKIPELFGETKRTAPTPTIHPAINHDAKVEENITESESKPDTKKLRPLPIILTVVILLILSASAYVLMSRGMPVGGSPDQAWKKQADYKEQKKVIDGVIKDYSQALENQNVDEAVSFFAADQQEFYRSILAQSTELMPEMAQDLKTAEMTFLSIDEGLEEPEFNRIAEYEIQCDDYTFSILFMKEQDRWVIVQM